MSEDTDKEQLPAERDSKGRLLPGHPPLEGGGRPKGSKNKITLAKLALEEALRESLAPDMAKVAAKVVAQALNGDKASQKLVWDSIMSKQAVSEDKQAGSKQKITVHTMNVGRGEVLEGEIVNETIEEDISHE